jgi:hypothetical protein
VKVTFAGLRKRVSDDNDAYLLLEELRWHGTPGLRSLRARTDFSSKLDKIHPRVGDTFPVPFDDDSVTGF